MSINWIAFDIETVCDPLELDPDPKKGWDRLRAGEGGISIAVSWDSVSQEYELYDGHTTWELIERLEEFPVVSAYNHDFDIPFLEGFAGRRLNIQHVVDPLDWLKAHYQKPVKGTKLAHIADWTLGETKDPDASGAHAPGMFARGEIAKLVRYCRRDVYLLRELVRHVQKEGYLHGPDGRVDVVVPAWLKDLR